MQQPKIPKAVQSRIPVYLHYLKSAAIADREYVSSASIAKDVKLGEVQVRKDLAILSGVGRPKIGYNKNELIDRLAYLVGHDDSVKAVIYGAGKLGKALLCYEGFAEYGIDIIAAFDNDKAKLGLFEGKPILEDVELQSFCAENCVRIGIVTVPEKYAQKACDEFVKSNIAAIWNFAPGRLDVPDGIIIKNENLAAALAVVSVRVKNER